MKIETQPIEDRQVKMTVVVEPEQFEETKQRAARKLARQIKIPGFRPGKAPYPVIVRHIGEPAINEEAIELLVNDVYPQAIKEAEIDPYGPGSLEQIVSIDPPTFEFTIPLKADVVLGDYRSIRRDYSPSPVTSDRIDETLKNLRERNAIIEPVERSAQEGDQVSINLRADRKNPGEGQSATLINNRTLSSVIEPEANGNPLEWPFPGFSRRLIDRSQGDEFNFDHVFSEDGEYESLRGIEATFFIAVERVSSRSLPELDDEFAKSMGDFSTMDELKDEIRKDMEEGTQAEYRDDYDDAILEEAVAGATIEYPPQMLKDEVHTVLHRLENSLAQQNLDIDLYLKMRQLDMAGLEEELKPVAEARLKKTLVLLEIAEAENIRVSPEDVQNETSRTIGEMSSYMEEKDLRKLISTEERRSNLVGGIMMDLLITKTKERLREYAQGIQPSAETEGEVVEAGTAEAPAETGEPRSEDASPDTKVEISNPDDETAGSEIPAAEIDNTGS